MSLEKLREQLREDSVKQVKQVLADAAASADKIVAEAEHERKKIVDDARKTALEDAGRKEVELYSARLEAKKILADAREKVVESVFIELRKLFESFVKKPEYKKFLKNAVDAGAKELGRECVVYVNKRDYELASKLGQYSVSKQFLECVGGAVIESSDGRIRVNNTVEALLEEKSSEIKVKAFEEFFSKKKRN